MQFWRVKERGRVPVILYSISFVLLVQRKRSWDILNSDSTFCFLMFLAAFQDFPLSIGILIFIKINKFMRLKMVSYLAITN